MKRIEFSPEAQNDLAEIADFYSNHSDRMARRILTSIRHRTHTVRANSLIGRARPDLGNDMRSFPAGEHIIYYKPIPQGVRILRIIHGAFDASKDDLP